jgi:RHS repeat-associated protein
VREDYAYDADGTRVSRTRGTVTTLYLGGLVEQEGTTTRTHYVFHGQVIAQREGSTVIYLHGDHLGSISVATSATGAIVSKQEFTPWGAVRSGGIGQTTLNYTGQRKDGTGLLYYGARYYDPGLARFVSADSVVPDSPKLTPLTVDFHEPDFANTLGDEAVLLAHKGFFAADTMHTGPRNPQTLNRYSYVGNNPLRTTDPTGHGCAATTVGSSCEELYDTNGQAGTAYEAGEGAPEGGDGPAAEAATNERGPSEESERVAEPKSAGEGRASGRGRGAHPEAETGDEEGRVKNNSRGRRGSAYNRPPTGKRPKNYRTGVTEKVRAKNNGKCIYCGEDADTNDHVKPWEDIKQGASSRGEEIDHYNDTENMEPACGSCNSSKGVRDAPNPNRQRR